MSRLKWPLLIFLRYYRSLGLRVSLYALLSLLAASISPLLERLLSDEITGLMDFQSVMPVLTILASSMLAVSTFSLNIMVSAHRAAAETTTPRVHRILLENTTTQSVLATFIGAFVYSLTSIILYQAGFYSDGAAVVVMTVTIGVVILVIVAMLRWIQHLTDLGSVDDSLHSATSRARTTLKNLRDMPSFGAIPLTPETTLPMETTPIKASESGYLQLIDVPKLGDCLPESGFIYVLHKPGAHVLKGQTLAEVSGQMDDERAEKLSGCFTLGTERTLEQDAEFGLTVLSEIGSKALSPGINDSGTAIAAVLILKDLLWEFADSEDAPAEPDEPHVFVTVPDHTDLFSAAFSQIARDGAGSIEVALQLRQALAALAASQDPKTQDAAREAAALAMRYAERAELLESEIERLRAISV